LAESRSDSQDVTQNVGLSSGSAQEDFEVEVEAVEATPTQDIFKKPSIFQLPRKDLQTSQEETRATLAKRLLWILVGTLVATTIFILGIEIKSYVKGDDKASENLVKVNDSVSIYVVKEKPDDGNKDLLNLIWTTQVTLVSGALGFYFGAKD
jgi:hypothetical protein